MIETNVQILYTCNGCVSFIPRKYPSPHTHRLWLALASCSLPLTNFPSRLQSNTSRLTQIPFLSEPDVHITSVLELRRALSETSPPSDAIILVTDSADDSDPVLLENCALLSSYSLPHDSKEIFIFYRRFVALPSDSAESFTLPASSIHLLTRLSRPAAQQHLLMLQDSRRTIDFKMKWSNLQGGRCRQWRGNLRWESVV